MLDGDDRGGSEGRQDRAGRGGGEAVEQLLRARLALGEGGRELAGEVAGVGVLDLDHLRDARHAGLVELLHQRLDAADGVRGVGEDEVVRLLQDGEGALALRLRLQEVAHLGGGDVLDREDARHEAVLGRRPAR